MFDVFVLNYQLVDLLLLDKSSNSVARQSVRLSMPIHLLIFALKK